MQSSDGSNKKTKQSKGGKEDSIFLNFDQFVEIVDILQDAMDGLTTDLDGDDDFDYEDDGELTDDDLNFDEEEADSKSKKSAKVGKETKIPVSTTITAAAGKDTSAGKSPPPAATKASPSAPKGKSKVEEIPPEDDEDDDSDKDPYDDLDDEEMMKEVAQELYDELRGKNTKLALSAFRAWDDIKDLLKDDLVTAKELDAVINEFAKGMFLL